MMDVCTYMARGMKNLSRGAEKEEVESQHSMNANQTGDMDFERPDNETVVIRSEQCGKGIQRSMAGRKSIHKVMR